MANEDSYKLVLFVILMFINVVIGILVYICLRKVCDKPKKKTKQVERKRQPSLVLKTVDQSTRDSKFLGF